MSIKNKSLISVNDLSDQDIDLIFHRAKELKKLGAQKKSFRLAFDRDKERDYNAFLVFAEPSTRTRFSFQTACLQFRYFPLDFFKCQSLKHS